MDILVVGGAGFIGTNLIQYLLDKHPDYNIVCIDKLLSSNRKKNLEVFETNSRFYFYQYNEGGLLKLFKFFYGFDVIINFLEENDAETIFNLLTIIKKYKTKKYVQVSPRTPEFTSLDIISLSNFSIYKIPVIISKYLNNYGDFQESSGFVASIITNALEGNRILVPSSNVTDLLNVLDYCRGLETLIHYGNPGCVYELGGGNKIESIDVALFIMDYLKVSKDMLECVSSKKINVMGYSALSEQFGWQPRINLNEGLIDTIEWYKENQNWWKNKV